jgi:aminocarboxymuconate-semialdehyde decarboxylase
MNLGKATMAELSKRALSGRVPTVDIHTHVYLPRYADELRARSSAPRIYRRISADGQPEERLLILDGEPGVGRPVGPQVGCQDPIVYRADLRCSESTGTETKNCCL